jgi:hypothetical protein
VPQPLSLLDFLRGLQTDAEFRSAFTANPEATIAEHGLAELSPADVHDALVLVEDTETADFRQHVDLADTGLHTAPPPVHGAEQAAVQYLSDYLAVSFPGADVPPDPDPDLDASFASGGVDTDPYAADTYDVDFGLGSDSYEPAADLDDGSGDLGFGHADGAFGDHGLGHDTFSGDTPGDGTFGDHGFGGARAYIGEPDDTGLDDAGLDHSAAPGHPGADEPPHPID